MKLSVKTRHGQKNGTDRYYEEDITSWFSDNDYYLPYIMQEANLVPCRARR